MQFAKKMTLIPYQEGDGPDEFIASTSSAPETASALTPQEPVRKSNSIRKYAIDRQTKMLNVILKLAQKKCYDGQAMINLENGERFSILPLLAHCFSPGRSVRGLDHFIEIMHEAGVQPDDVINQSVKDQLMMRRRSGQNNVEIEDEEVVEQQPPRRIVKAKRRIIPGPRVDTEEPRKLRSASTKRRSDEDEDQPQKVQKTVDWSVDDSDLDENDD